MDSTTTKKRKPDDTNGANTSPQQQTPTTLTPDDAVKFLDPLSPEQLRQILEPVVINHPDILNSVRSILDSDLTLRKLFIRGLSAETSTESLRTVFSSFGDIDEAIVITDKNTGKSKGYGFVTFKHVDGAVLALKEPSKKIDGRVTVTQLAASGKSESKTDGGDVSLRKIYVGNVPFEISSERLLEYFSMFGEIEEGPLGFDKTTGKPRGFAFFLYKSEEGARAAIAEPMKSIDGHQVMCKLAVDNKKSKPGGAGVGGQGVSGGGMQPGAQQGSGMPGSYPGSMFGGPAGIGGIGGMPSSYQGPPGMPSSNYGYSSAMPPPAVSGLGSQMMPSMSGGMGGGYGGSQYGGPSLGDYGGMSNPGSFMQRGPPGSIAMPSGGYPDVGHTGLSSGGLPPQSQPPPRIPPGGMYQGHPPYY